MDYEITKEKDIYIDGKHVIAGSKYSTEAKTIKKETQEVQNLLREGYISEVKENGNE